MKTGTLKQILLMTDGCSNQGEDPVAVAALAHEQGITVNVIGILDENHSENRGLQEVEGIASSGGGISQFVYKEALPHTVQTVTKQAMTQTLQGFVNTELKQILKSTQTIEDLEPTQRGEIMEVVEDLGETSDLEVLVLIDMSASMSEKITMVKEALRDLSISLSARIGRNRFAVFIFPGKRRDIKKIFNWSPTMEQIEKAFPKLTSGGVTPTGPALREAMYQFSKRNLLRSFRRDDYTEEA